MNNHTESTIIDCLKLIELQLGWGPVEQWKQRDYEQLSELILEKTGTRLSLSTLKRASSGKFANQPQPATLNALAQFAGFKSWSDFQTSNSLTGHPNSEVPYTSPENPVRKRNSKQLWIGLGLLLLLGTVILLLLKIRSTESFPSDSTVELKPETAFRHKILAEGLPNTVVFSFNLENIKADSFFFQQTWKDWSRVSIPPNSKNFTSIYYYPGYHLAKLFAGKTQIAEQRVHVKTKGWVGLIDQDINQAMPVYIENPISNGMLFTPPSSLPIQKFLAEKIQFFVRYYNIEEFSGITGDDFVFSAKIRNDIEHGGLTCQDLEFYLFCESGMIIVPFSMPGCVGNLNLLAGNNVMAGRNNDLSALGINLSEWQDIVVLSGNKNIQIKTTSGQLSVTYTDPLGVIKGMMIKFKGSGAVDEMRLGNAKDKMKYEWNFD